MAYGNAQRSSVFDTKGLDDVPRQTLWKSKQLFQYREPNTDESTILRFLNATSLEAFSRPIVSNGVIFFSFRGESAYLYAIDALTGKELEILKFEKSFLSDPVAIGTTVFFGNGYGVHAFEITKRVEKWTFEPKGLSFSSSEPIINDGVIYMYGVGMGAGLYALNAGGGQVKWTFHSAHLLYGPAISGDELILVDPKGLLLALDKKTGTKKWEAKIDSGASAPAILDDQIFLPFKSGEIRAYGLSDGSFKWKSKKSGSTRTALVLFKGEVIYGGHEDSIVALNAKSGLEVWKFRTNLPCHNPIVAGDLLYAVCEDHKLYAVDPLTGDERWRLENKKATPPPPTFADGVMYMLGTDGVLSAMK
jgi:serine/threonine-protein kinase